MVNIKTIIYSNGLEEYNEFTNTHKKYCNTTVYIKDSVEFLREILVSKKLVTVIFIESAMVDKISDSLSVLLMEENFFCVLFSKDNVSDNEYRDYLNDYLQCDYRVRIENFYKRLSRNIYYKVKLLSNYKLQNKFYNIGKQLSAEKDIDRLTNSIVNYSMEICQCDAASIYIIIDRETREYSFYEKNAESKLLQFKVAKNNSIDIELQATTTEITIDSIIGASVINGEPIRIEDAYNISEDKEYRFNKNFDKITGYKTQSVLTIPMKDHEGRILGVIQLINKKEKGKIIPFIISDEEIIFSLAGQTAVVLENNMIYKNLNMLLEKDRDKIAEEINKRKSADEEINKLLSAIEHSPACVIITDAEGRTEYVNRKFEKLTGYTIAEVINKNLRILKSGIQSKEFYKKLWATISKGEDWQGEMHNKKKNGEYYWANCSIAPVKDSSGAIKYFIAIQEDITEKKELLQELKEKNKNLEETLKQLNLSQVKLIQSEKLAGIGQLAAGIAHEINNPLGFIISNLNSLSKHYNKINDLILLYKSLSDNVDDSKYNDMIKSIEVYEKENKVNFILNDIWEIIDESKEGLLRVSNIVKALSSFSNIDKLQGVQVYDLNENINDTLIILKNEIGNYIKVYIDLGNIPLINVDGREINGVLLNLIKNAVYAIKDKFNNEDKGIINIKTYSDDSYVFIEIEDNGIGIEEKYVHKVYDPFFTTKPVGMGTGLGLSIAYEVVVKKHKGEISFTTELGVGTKFIIKLQK